MDAITVDNLVKRYGELTAVKGVTFNVNQGEVFGFLGPNGAGKTTTIHMLCTLLRPTSGTAKVNGYDVATQRSDVRRSLGLVFQDTTLDDYLTAEQNLLFHAYAYSVPQVERTERMETLLKMLELWDRRKERTNKYSGGMKRRLEIVRGLLHHPKVLFLDEPTIGLDPQTRNSIWSYLHGLRKQEDLTIFLTTHYMDEAENCDRIAIIDHGEIVALGTPDELKRSVGGDVITVKAPDNAAMAAELRERYGVTTTVQDGHVAFTVPHGDEFIPQVVRDSRQRLESISLHRPTLDDVFLSVTGKSIREQEGDPMSAMRRMMQARMGGGMRR